MKNNGFPKSNFTAFMTCFSHGLSGLRNMLLVFLIALTFTACMTAAIPGSNETAVLKASEVPAQTETPTAEATLTPTNTATPTATEIPPLELADFSAELKGKGVHGGMVCYSYAGDAKDLEGLTLLADISRDGKAIEKKISPEQIDGENCFEITDANYLSVSPNAEGGRLLIPEEPLSVKITAAQEGRVLSNNAQTIDLGKYVQFPFLQWIYPEGVKAGCTDNYHFRENPNTKEKIPYPAWDFIPKPSNEYPTLVGTPVLAPVDGIAYVFSINSGEETDPIKINAITIYTYDTGFLVNLTHEHGLALQDGKWIMINELLGREVSAGEEIGIIGPKDSASTMPHTHVQTLIPKERLDFSKEPLRLNELILNYFTDINVPNIDFLKERLFVDEALNDRFNNMPNTNSACQTYAWGEVVIPQQLPFKIDGKADDWAEYKPVLTDKIGDSEAGKVMDFSELYMAKDDNYLYLMLKAGEKPSGEWVTDFLMDLFNEDKCGNSERSVYIWSKYPDLFSIKSVDECEDLETQRYPAEYMWGGDGLEIRIPLPYIRNPLDPKVIDTTGFIIDSQGQVSSPDYMD